MSWFRVCDNFYAHRKLRRAGLLAAGLWVACGSYASSQACDGSGHLEDDDVEFVAIGAGTKNWRAAADKLVKVGLWERTETGYRFHDWADYLPKGEAELERRRAKDADRKRRARLEATSADVSADNPRTRPRTSADLRPHPPVPSRPVPSNPERSPPPPTGGDAPSAVRVDDPAGMLVGRWTMGIRSVTDRPVSRLSPSDTRALHAAAEAHAAGLRGEALLAWAETEGAEFARSCDAKFGGFSARRFATWLDAGKPKDGPPVAKVGADGLVHPRARDGRPLQPYDPSAPYMRPVARGRVERATNEDAAEILAAMPLRNQGAAE